MSSDYDSDSNSEMDLLEMAECILRDFLIFSSSVCDDIVSDECDGENEMTTNHIPDNEHNHNIDNILWESNKATCEVLPSTEDITCSNLTLNCGETKCRETDDVSATGLDTTGDYVAVTEGIMELCDLVRAMCNDLQQCSKDLNPDPIDLQHSVDTGKKVGNQVPIDLQHSVDTHKMMGNLNHSVNPGEKMVNLGPSDMHHLVDTGKKMGDLDPSDLYHLREMVVNLDPIDSQHSLDTGKKVVNPNLIDSQHSVDTGKKVVNPNPIGSKHSADTGKMVVNPNPIDSQHSVDTGEKVLNPNPIDLQHLVDEGVKVVNPNPIDSQHSMDTGEKVRNLNPDPSVIHHLQQDFSSSEDEPRHPAMVDMLNELFEFREKDENQQKEYHEQMLRDLSDAIIPITKSVMKLFIEQPKYSNAVHSNRQPSELNFGVIGVITMELLDLFRSKGETGNKLDKNTEETAVKEKRCAERTGWNSWITWIDGIYELVEFYRDIKISNKAGTEDNDRRKNMKETRTTNRDGNTNCKKDTRKLPVTIWPEVVKDGITDLVKLIILWLNPRCQEVAADSSYEADDVFVCGDGCSIDDLFNILDKSVAPSENQKDQFISDLLYKVGIHLFVVSNILNPVHSSHIKTESNIKTDINIKTDSNINAESNIKAERKIKTDCNIKAESNIKAERNIKAECNIRTEGNIKAESNIKTESEDEFISDLFQFLNWINDNSSYFTNIECTDTDAILPNIVNWLINWAYSAMTSGDDYVCDSHDEFFQFIKNLLKNLVKVFTIICVLLLCLRFHDDRITTGLKSIGIIFPYIEYFLRNALRICFSWFLFLFSKNVSFTEKTYTFGRRLMKKVSVLELLVFSRQEKQPTPSKIKELLEIVKKLNDDFQVINISRRLKPELFECKQHGDSVHTQTDIKNYDIECKSVADMLWLKYQDTLSQSNWCNAFTDLSKMLDMFIDDLMSQMDFTAIADFIYFKQYTKSYFTPIVSGSRLDGCVSLLSEPSNACDFDVMSVVFRSDNFILEWIPDRPTSVVFKTVSNFIFTNSNEGYLNPLHIKKDIFSFYLLMPILLAGSYIMLYEPFHRIWNLAFSLQKGDVADTFLLFQQGKDVILSLDYVLAVSIDSWPDQAKNWIYRNNDWPVFETRETISRGGCHAVAKTPKGGDPNKEWRLSFSKAENTLCKIFTPSQAFHFSLLKTQFKSLISKIGSYKVRIFKNYTITKGVFHTYHAKTAMFWFCEKHPPTHDIWKKENVFICQCELLESMEGMMKDGNIPLYFIPEQNLLEDIPVKLLQQAAGELSFLKEEARSEDGRVYQEIIKQPPHEDKFLCLLKQIKSMITKLNDFRN